MDRQGGFAIGLNGKNHLIYLLDTAFIYNTENYNIFFFFPLFLSSFGR
jgi:hypothetical protein